MTKIRPPIFNYNTLQLNRTLLKLTKIVKKKDYPFGDRKPSKLCISQKYKNQKKKKLFLNFYPHIYQQNTHFP